jgi:hypothetical protein
MIDEEYFGSLAAQTRTITWARSSGNGFWDSLASWSGGTEDVTLRANTSLYRSRKNLAPREINDLGCAKAGLVGHSNGYTQLM